MSAQTPIVDTSKYQLMPDMSPAEFEALKADIAERGVLVPIDVDETGEILDGHHRYRAWADLKKNEPPPIIVREGLSEQEKRAFARKNNILRRHLTREQIRRLIAEQLKDTPEWANNRIAEELGVDGKTVGAVRDDLEATSEIPKLDRLVGKDGKARPTRQSSRQSADLDDDDDAWEAPPRKQRRRHGEWDEWADPVKAAKMMHAADLIGMGADPNSEKVQTLIREATVITFASPPRTYDPLAGRSEAEKLEWHIFMMFISYDGESHRAGYAPLDASRHVEYVLQRPFQNVDEWLGPEGEKWRRMCRYARPTMHPQFLADWVAFRDAHRHCTLEEIIRKVDDLQRQFEKDRDAGLIKKRRR
jgi:ParB-like chromosome segregation protein Spo0J